MGLILWDLDGNGNLSSDIDIPPDSQQLGNGRRIYLSIQWSLCFGTFLELDARVGRFKTNRSCSDIMRTDSPIVHAIQKCHSYRRALPTVAPIQHPNHIVTIMIERSKETSTLYFKVSFFFAVSNNSQPDHRNSKNPSKASTDPQKQKSQKGTSSLQIFRWGYALPYHL